ncbi:hypothetical protein KCU93_g281, partial [Aureobasidium melanogenum]
MRTGKAFRSHHGDIRVYHCLQEHGVTPSNKSVDRSGWDRRLARRNFVSDCVSVCTLQYVLCKFSQLRFSDPEDSQSPDACSRSGIQDDSSMQGNMAAASWMHTNSLPNIEPSTASFMISDEFLHAGSHAQSVTGGGHDLAGREYKQMNGVPSNDIRTPGRLSAVA